MSKTNKKLSGNNGFKKYRILACILLISLISLISFASFKYYRNYQIEKYSHLIVLSAEALEKGDEQSAQNNLEQIIKGNAPETTKSLARLNYAYILHNKGKIKESSEIYYEIGNCNHCNQFIKELAQLLYIKVKPQITPDIDADEFLGYIDNVISSSKFLTSHISEQKGIFAYNNSRYDIASETLVSVIKDEELPNSVRERAKDILAKIAKKRSETDIDIDKQEKEEISLRKKPLEYKIKDTTNKQNFDENSTSNDKNNNDKNKKVKSDK